MAMKVNEAKISAGNDMLKVMQYVFPIIVQIEMDIIKKFGFSDNREGRKAELLHFFFFLLLS